MQIGRKTDALIIGGGIAGIVAALELLDGGARVTILDRSSPDRFGGLALWAFGGMLLVDTPLQRRLGIRDSAKIAMSDWMHAAEFEQGDVWPKKWAEHYVDRSVPDIYEWLRAKGLSFMSAVQWVERGTMRPGNSLPRYHMLWGTSHFMISSLIDRLRQHPRSANLEMKFHHRVDKLSVSDGRIVGCIGVDNASGQPFQIEAGTVIVASGGTTGNIERVRQNWPAHFGKAPKVLLNGSHPQADGLMHDAAALIGGNITHLDQMWNYAAGVHPPKPHFDGHGLSLVPTKSGLWLDPRGRRIGPVPFMSGFDTYEMVEEISKRGYPYTWMLMNRKIAEKELAISGSEHNPLMRDRRMLAFLLQILKGSKGLIDHLLKDCIDFVSAPDLDGLARGMNRLAESEMIDPAVLAAELAPFDDQIARGPKFHNDDQLRRIAQLRNWTSDRVRTCNFQRISDPDAGPFIAIRCFLLIRKSMGGIQTDLQSRVLTPAGHAIEGLYAVGEAAGFGGGGMAGKRSLEGTFLSGCILTAREAAKSILNRGKNPS